MGRWGGSRACRMWANLGFFLKGSLPNASMAACWAIAALPSRSCWPAFVTAGSVDGKHIGQISR